jgi:hypothetical protein
MVGEGFPTLRGLALDVGLAGFPLGVQRVKFLLQSMLGGFPAVDGAAEEFGVSWHRNPPGWTGIGAQKTGDRSIWWR